MSDEMVVKDYSVQEVIDRVKAVNELYKAVMQKDQHYGEIVAGKKPTLLKAGAEKICAMFSLSPKTEKMEMRELGGGHREVTITIGLIHRRSGEFWGDGSGSCSTMESKYRWRDKLQAVRPVPKEYWSEKNPAYLDGMKARKVDGQWMLCIAEREENPDIADIFNTVLKMAEKRALVSAVLKATGVSDIFTQDIEDMPQFQKDEATGRNENGADKAFVATSNEEAKLRIVVENIKSASTKQELIIAKNEAKKIRWSDESTAKIKEAYQEKMSDFDNKGE